MDRTAFIKQLLRVPPAEFVEHHLFDRIPFAFSQDRSSFIAWKRVLGNEIDVDPACITIVGSAATGLSLNPNKSFKSFDANSDIDVGVVSTLHFNIAWRYLRMNGDRRYKVDLRTRNAWEEHASKYIYWGTIATDRLLGVLPFGLQWLSAATKVAQIRPTEGRSINMRIYSDFDSLRSYHIQGVKSLRNTLIAKAQ